MKIRIKNEKLGYVNIQLGSRQLHLNRGQTAQVDVDTDKDGILLGPPDILAAIELGKVKVVEGDVKLPKKEAPKAVEEPAKPESKKPKAKAVEEPAKPKEDAPKTQDEPVKPKNNDEQPVLPLIPQETEEGQ